LDFWFENKPSGHPVEAANSLFLLPCLAKDEMSDESTIIFLGGGATQTASVFLRYRLQHFHSILTYFMLHFGYTQSVYM
jgi:hypothetical protein